MASELQGGTRGQGSRAGNGAKPEEEHTQGASTLQRGTRNQLGKRTPSIAWRLSRYLWCCLHSTDFEIQPSSHGLPDAWDNAVPGVGVRRPPARGNVDMMPKSLPAVSTRTVISKEHCWVARGCVERAPYPRHESRSLRDARGASSHDSLSK